MAVPDRTPHDAGEIHALPARPSRKRVPQHVAVIDAENCTGCEACVEICPVDCIELREVGAGIKGLEAWCEVDPKRCIGCELCIRLPHRDRTDAYRLLVCPWEAIEMVPCHG